MKEAAEKAKQELSILEETEINLPFIAADGKAAKHLRMKFTRRKLEELCEDLITKLEEPCRQAMEDSGLKESEIDQVIMVGGMTRMPAIQEKVKQIFGKEPNTNLNPDEVVAVGAATQGAVLKGEIRDVLLLDVTPLSLGVETFGGVFTRLIPRNTPVPTRKSQIFTTAEDEQEFVNVHVLQGEREMAEGNISLGRFQLVGIRPAPRGVPQIEVTFAIDADGIVHVSAKDLDTGKEQSIKITAKSGLTRDEVERIISEANAYKQEDERRRQVADIKSQVSGLVYTIERTLAEVGGSISASERENVEKVLKEAKASLEQNDAQKLQEFIGKLSQVSTQIMEAIARAGSKSPAAETEEKKDFLPDSDFDEIEIDLDD